MYSFAFRQTEAEDKHYTVKYSKENQARLFAMFRLFNKNKPFTVVYHEEKRWGDTTTPSKVVAHKVNFRNKKITVVGGTEEYELVLIDY
jgi:hypothetical protein